MTKARTRVLEILRTAAEPLSATGVLTLMENDVDQVTVYRTLHYLEENGFADSFMLHCDAHGTERYYSASASGESGCAVHRHWFHCERCHRFTDLGGCCLEALVSSYETRHGFSVHTHTLYLTGVCASCKNENRSVF